MLFGLFYSASFVLTLPLRCLTSSLPSYDGRRTKETATCRLAGALDLSERTLRNLFRVRRGPAARLTVQFFHPLTSLSTWWVGCRHRGVTLLWAITPLLGRDASQPHRLFFFPDSTRRKICRKDKLHSAIKQRLCKNSFSNISIICRSTVISR